MNNITEATAQNALNTIIAYTMETMVNEAAKAGAVITKEEILAEMHANPEGNTAKRFASYMALGIKTAAESI